MRRARHTARGARRWRGSAACLDPLIGSAAADLYRLPASADRTPESPVRVSPHIGRNPICPPRQAKTNLSEGETPVRARISNRLAREESGFTLIELLVVVIIIGILLAI